MTKPEAEQPQQIMSRAYQKNSLEEKSTISEEYDKQIQGKLKIILQSRNRSSNMSKVLPGIVSSGKCRSSKLTDYSIILIEEAVRDRFSKPLYFLFYISFCSW